MQVQEFEVDVVYFVYNSVYLKVIAPDREAAYAIAEKIFKNKHSKECHLHTIRLRGEQEAATFEVPKST